MSKVVKGSPPSESGVAESKRVMNEWNNNKEVEGLPGTSARSLDTRERVDRFKRLPRRFQDYYM